MKPILYTANATNFFNLGLGVLSDTYSCLVYEKRNGAFYLEMEYPVEGALFKELQNNRLIKADAGHELKDQRFKIKKITKPIDGKVKVYAEHISYKAAELALKPHVNIRNATAQQALQQWQNNFIDDDKPFTLSSNITTVNSTSWSIREIENPRQALGGVQGSILDVWGGEYKFDNYHISLFRERGVRANALIAYGRNITDFEQEEDITSVYTSIYPYGVYTDEDGVEHLVTIPEYIVDSEHVDKYPNRMVLPVDFTTEFGSEETPTVQRLRSMAQSYIESNEIGIPKVSIRLTHVDLSKTLDYKQYKGLEKVNLCDNVLVKFLKLDVDTTAKVIGIIWNVLLERYEELEIGESRSSLSSRLNAIDQEARQARKEASDARNFSAVAANGINMVFFGPDEPTATKVGDRWFEENGEFTISRVWDGVIWRVIHDPRIEDALKEEMRENTRLVNEAKEAADQALVAGQDALKAGLDAQQAADEALVAGNEAKTLGEQAQTAADDALAAGNQAQSLAEQAKADASEATTRANTANQQINDAIQNAGFTSLNALTSNLRSISEDAQLRADEAVSDALNALSNAQSALSGLSDVESSISNIRIDIDEIEGTLGLKASQTDLNSITGIVDQHTLDIQANAQGLTAKADRSTVDTLSGNVTTLSNQLNFVSGELSSKISQTQLNAAIEDVEIGGRNYLISSLELKQPWIFRNDVSREVFNGNEYMVKHIAGGTGRYAGYNTSNFGFDFTDGDQWYTISVIAKGNIDQDIAITLDAWNLAYGRQQLTNEWQVFSWSFKGEFRGLSTFRFVILGDVSSENPAYWRRPKVELGSKKTDWTQAPEDTAELISHIQSEWTQTFDGFQSTVSSIDGRVTQQRQDLDSVVTSISNAEGQISIIQSTVDGIQSTVSDKANQSDLTLLSNAFDVSVREQINSMWTVLTNYTSGSNVAYRRVSDNSVLQLDVTGNNNATSGNDHRIWTSSMTGGTQYTISFEARKISGTTPGRVTFGQSGTSITTGLEISISSGWGQFGGAYTAVNSNAASLFFHVEGRYELRNIKMYLGGGASQGQITVLQDAINLRVLKGDVMSQINVEAGRTLIQSDRLLLDADTVLFTGSAFIPGASIVDATINSAKITNAAITTAKIGDAQINNAKIANLAVNEAKIANLAVSTAKIANAAITNAKIGNLAVGTAQIASGAITSAKIGTVAIQTAHIGDAQITNAKIASLSASKLTAGTIDASQINVINLDASDIMAGTISGANMYLSLNAGHFHSEGTYEEEAISFNPGDHDPFVFPAYVDIRDGVITSTNPDSGLGGRLTEIAAGTIYMVSNPDSLIRSDIQLSGGGIQFGQGARAGAISPGSGFIMQDHNNDRHAQYNYDGLTLARSERDIYFGVDGLRLSNGAYIERIGPVSDGMIWSVPGFMDFWSWGARAFAVYEGGVNYFRNLTMTGSNNNINARNINANETDLLRLNGTRNELADLTLGAYSGGQRYFRSSAVYDLPISSTSQVGITASGDFRRITSARKYKIDITTADNQLDLGRRLLSLDLTKWFDKGDTERYAEALTNGSSFEGIEPIKMHYGLIAEDVEEAGLSQFVDYQNGEVEGIYYDRLWIPLIAVVRDLDQREDNTLKVASHAYLLAEQHEDELAEAKRKIKQLEEKVKRLEGAA